MKASPHRPTKALIYLGAIRQNIQQMEAHIPERTLKWAVVKANAYGHGAVAVATAIQDDVDGFCVSNIDEAIELRLAGLSKKILILGVSELEAVSLAKEYDITLTVAGLEWIQALLARETDLSGLTVHLKIDSGWDELVLEKPARLSRLKPCSNNTVLALRGFLPTLLLQMKNQMTILMPS